TQIILDPNQARGDCPGPRAAHLVLHQEFRDMKRSAWFSILSLLAIGCGSYGDVKGKVVFKGAPVKFASVTAEASNGSIQATSDENGEYQMSKVGTGKVKFYVYCSNPEAEKILKDALAKLKEGEGEKKGAGRGAALNLESMPTKASMKLPPTNLVPTKYSDRVKDLLVFDVAPYPTTINLSLEP